MDIRMMIVFACALAFLGITAACLRRFFGAELKGVRARLVAAFHGSSTILVARLTALGGAALELAANGADLFDAPGIRDAVQGVIPPGWWPFVLLAVGLTTELARRRSLSEGPK
jgi:hypothetical protein